MALWAGLLGCFPELVAGTFKAGELLKRRDNHSHFTDLKHPLFSLTCHLYTCILLPLLHSLWLLTGAGNANFFYAATMVYGLNSTLAIADVLGAIIGQDLKQRLLPLIFETNTDCDVEPISVVQLATLD